MLKLSRGQTAVLVIAAAPMVAVGFAGAVATYVNMDNVLHRGASALGLVAAGEGATLICALVALAVTLMGQHTPATVRLGMWLVPLAASAVGIALAPSRSEAVVMGFTPLAMTAAGEGVAFVARRVVAYRTGVDIEQQRRSGLLLWHANRAANGGRIGSRVSRGAVWRLTRRFAETDTQLSVQLGEVQRFRIQQGADANLAAVLARPQKAPEAPVKSLTASARYIGPSGSGKATKGPAQPASLWFTPKGGLPAENLGDACRALADRDAECFGTYDYVTEALEEAEAVVAADPSVKLLTTAEVAALKGVQAATVRSWAHRYPERFPRRQMVDGVAMYHPLDIADLD